MRLLGEYALTDLRALCVHAEAAQVVIWQGCEALRLENGLALMPHPPLADARIADARIADARIEVSIGADAAAYPGIAFRVADRLNYELAYAVPHVSGAWDALQYDPVFHGSNTWQFYHGSSYQRAAQVPTGRWFRLQVAYCGSRAVVTVDDQPPLVIERLACPAASGLLGVWTFRPAYFCDLRVSTCDALAGPPGEQPCAAEDMVEAWFLEDYGRVNCEPHGVLNLNRYLPLTLGEARLTRQFELAEDGTVRLNFGFSDALTLELDGERVFSGTHTFQGFADRVARGYVELGRHALQRTLTAGTHRLTALLETQEPFGWGIVLSAHGPGLRWLSVV